MFASCTCLPVSGSWLWLCVCVLECVCVWKGEVVIRTPSLHGFAHHTLRVCVWAWGVFFIVMKSWFNDACFLCVSLHLSVVPALIQSPSALDPIPIWWLGLMRAGSQACLSVCVLCINTLVGTFFGGGRGLLFVVVGGHFCRSLLCNHVLVV